MASLTIVPYNPFANASRNGHQFPSRGAFKIDDRNKALRIEPGIPLIDVPQPLLIGAGRLPTNEKSSNTSDGDDLPLKRQTHGSAHASQSQDKGALISVGEFEEVSSARKHGIPDPARKQ
jgi:hypothetical protein